MEEFKGTKGRWVYSAETGTIRGDGGLLAELLINGSEDDNGTLMAATPYQLNAVKNATNQFPSHGALPFPAARRARSANPSSS